MIDDVTELHEQIQKLAGDREAASLRISEMERRLSRVERVRRDTAETPDYFEVRDSLEKVRAITAEIFSGEIALSEREDPEVAGDRYFTIGIVDGGDADAMLSRYDEWHARLCELPPHVRSMFRLSIDVQS
jgi:cell shape-determining protein MreC